MDARTKALFDVYKVALRNLVALADDKARSNEDLGKAIREDIVPLLKASGSLSVSGTRR